MLHFMVRFKIRIFSWSRTFALLVILKGSNFQPQIQIREMCCLCARTNLVAWIEVIYNHTVHFHQLVINIMRNVFRGNLLFILLHFISLVV